MCLIEKFNYIIENDLDKRTAYDTKTGKQIEICVPKRVVVQLIRTKCHLVSNIVYILHKFLYCGYFADSLLYFLNFLSLAKFEYFHSFYGY